MSGGRRCLELAWWAVKITIITFITLADCLEVEVAAAAGMGMAGHVVYKPLTISIIIKLQRGR